MLSGTSCIQFFELHPLKVFSIKQSVLLLWRNMIPSLFQLNTLYIFPCSDWSIGVWKRTFYSWKFNAMLHAVQIFLKIFKWNPLFYNIFAWYCMFMNFKNAAWCVIFKLNSYSQYTLRCMWKIKTIALGEYNIDNRMLCYGTI